MGTILFVTQFGCRSVSVECIFVLQYSSLSTNFFCHKILIVITVNNSFSNFEKYDMVTCYTK